MNPDNEAFLKALAPTFRQDQDSAQLRDWEAAVHELLQQLWPNLSSEERGSIQHLFYVATDTRSQLHSCLFEVLKITAQFMRSRDHSSAQAQYAEISGRFTELLVTLFAEGWVAALRVHGIVPPENPSSEDIPEPQ